jgi:hypothetical protein
MTLSLLTLALWNFILPIGAGKMVPVILDFSFDVSQTCQDMDDTFGTDPDWWQQCTSSLSIVKLATAGICLVLMAAQWWFVCQTRKLRRILQCRRRKSLDVETGGVCRTKS